MSSPGRRRTRVTSGAARRCAAGGGPAGRAWCRSPRPACCRWCRASSATSPACPTSALEQRRRPDLVLRRAALRPRLHGRLHRRLALVVRPWSPRCVEHRDLLTRVGGAVVIVLGLVFIGVGSGIELQRIAVRAGSRPPGWPAPPARRGLRARLGAVHGPDAGARSSRSPRRSAPTSRRPSRGRHPRRGLLAGARRPVPAHRRRVRAVGRVSALAAPPPARDPAVGGVLLLVVGVLMVTGVWDRPRSRGVQTHARRRLHDGAVMATQTPPRTADHPAARSAPSGWAALGLAVSSPACARRCSCCCCWRSPRCRGRSSRSAASTPRKVADYIAQQPDHRAVARPARVLRGLRLGLVLGDLPAARSSPSSAASSRAAGCTGMPCARSPPRAPARPRRLDQHVESRMPATSPPTRCSRPRKCCGAGDFGSRVTTTVGQRRERLPAGDRQPGLPPGSVVVIVGVAVGHLFGLAGRRHRADGRDVLVDAVGATTRSCPGRWVDPEKLPPFTIDAEGSMRTFEEHRAAASSARPASFTATSRRRSEPGGAADAVRRSRSNHPLTIDGADVFLLGNGYAPVMTVRDATGDGALPAGHAVPRPGQQLHVGGGDQGAGRRGRRQLGLQRVLPPDRRADRQRSGPTSIFPDARNPALALTVCEGDLFPGGRPAVGLHLDTTNADPADQGRRARRC